MSLLNTPIISFVACYRQRMQIWYNIDAVAPNWQQGGGGEHASMVYFFGIGCGIGSWLLLVQVVG